jgi:chromate transporter
MPAAPTFREALRFWLKLGCISFGGPAGQIATMHAELVERRGWIGEKVFLHALNFCMLLPGPEATQLAIYCGWRLHGFRGGLAAGILFVLPAALLLWALSWVYMVHGNLPAVTALFAGLKPAVVAIVAAALLRIGRRSLHGGLAWFLAAGAFAALFWGRVPFPVVVAVALAIGFLVARRWPGVLLKADPAGPLDPTDPAELTVPATVPAGRIAGWGTALWLAPVLAAGLLWGWDGTLARMGWFFSRAALVTFGGAYAVLPYVGQQSVEHFGWLAPGQMLDGLGLAETTPGPLIMVLQFVGFVGAWQHPGTLSPALAGALGALMTTWTTFVPSFVLIFLGAPYIERIRGYRPLAGALAAVTAAVVGVILNLAVWFGLQVFRGPASEVDVFAVSVAAAAFVAMQFLRVGIVPVVLGSALVGWATLVIG